MSHLRVILVYSFPFLWGRSHISLFSHAGMGDIKWRRQDRRSYCDVAFECNDPDKNKSIFKKENTNYETRLDYAFFLSNNLY